MKQRKRRNRWIPRLETCEDRTLLSGVGVNVELSYQYAGEAVWTDVSRLFGKWDYISPDRLNWWTPDPSVVTNSLGSPLSDAANYLTLANYPDGVYQVSFKGTADVAFWGVGNLVAPLVKGADGVTRGQILVNNATDVTNGLRDLVMNVTANDPTDPLYDLHIIAPGYPADGSQEYTNQFLQQLQPFDDIRFMNWELTNGSTMVHWSDRAQPGQLVSTFTGGQPVDYEAMIELGNEAHKNIWLNVPAMADDGFVKNLADLVRDKLDPGLKVHIEYSNETWNAGFKQRAYILDQANANPLVTATGDIAKVGQQTAFRLKQISDIFQQEFGAGFDRIIPVLGGWTINSGLLDTELQFIQTNYGDPSQFIKSTAIAPYIGLASGTDTAHQTAGGLFNSMNKYLTQLTTYIQQNVQVAASYGLPLDAYEGGQSLTGNVNGTTKWAVQNDPRMYTIYQRYLNIWKTAGGGEMDLFTFYGDFWGLKNRVTDAGGQKFDAVVSTLVPIGDATLDGKVDFADFQALAANYYAQSGKWWTQGDFNHDGKVDSADLGVLLAHMDAGALTADQAAQIAVFAQPSTITTDQSLDFELFGRSYASDLSYKVKSGGPVVADGTYNGLTAGSGLATLGGTVYEKGLGASSNSTIDVPLAGAYTTFDATIGVDDRAGAGKGASVFQVLGDGQVLYTSPVIERRARRFRSRFRSRGSPTSPWS